MTPRRSLAVGVGWADRSTPTWHLPNEVLPRRSRCGTSPHSEHRDEYRPQFWCRRRRPGTRPPSWTTSPQQSQLAMTARRRPDPALLAGLAPGDGDEARHGDRLPGGHRPLDPPDGREGPTWSATARRLAGHVLLRLNRRPAKRNRQHHALRWPARRSTSTPASR
ncbi:hypothetical protein HBB16_16530 [Pseudonocardia sp. MCCB 268]|nr:hypothetical protein [Pseudonocardia cytotoxica]